MLNINFVIFDTFLYYSNHHIMKRREFHYTIWYHYKRRTGTFVKKISDYGRVWKKIPLLFLWKKSKKKAPNPLRVAQYKQQTKKGGEFVSQTLMFKCRE